VHSMRDLGAARLSSKKTDFAELEEPIAVLAAIARRRRNKPAYSAQTGDDFPQALLETRAAKPLLRIALRPR
jgi:hypothetical protein